MIWNCIFVGTGGFAGTIFKYLFTLIPALNERAIPVQTLAVNVIGAFFIGLMIGIAQRHDWMSGRTLLFLKVGFCGGFTTFSTFSLETLDLLEGGRLILALLYILLSTLLCLVGVIAGRACGC